LVERHRTRLYERYASTSYNPANPELKAELDATAELFRINYGQHLPSRKDAPILDVGCGQGQFLYYLHKEGYTNFMGLDVSPEQVEAARGMFGGRVIASDAAAYLKAEEGRFALVAANDFVEHLTKAEAVEFLELASRALAPAGALILKTPNMANPFSLSTRYRDLTHEAGFTERSLFQLLSVAGFQDVRVFGERPNYKGAKGAVLTALMEAAHGLIRLGYYVQGYDVPKVMSKNLVAVARKG
jgi:2-polyprenyl-3-methyl-5-hydroxy-6-metoxy-1,4-benzoquinol methylase